MEHADKSEGSFLLKDSDRAAAASNQFCSKSKEPSRKMCDYQCRIYALM